MARTMHGGTSCRGTACHRTPASSVAIHGFRHPWGAAHPPTSHVSSVALTYPRRTRCLAAADKHASQYVHTDSNEQHGQGTWAALASATLDVARSRFNNSVPPAAVLMMMQLCASLRHSLTQQQLEWVCKELRQSLHTSSSQQCILLLSNLARITPAMNGRKQSNIAFGGDTTSIINWTNGRRPSMVWLKDVYNHVVNSENLSPEDLVNFLEAVRHFQGLSQQCVTTLVENSMLDTAANHASTTSEPTAHTAPHSRQLNGSITSKIAAQLLTSLADLKASIASDVVRLLVSRVEKDSGNQRNGFDLIKSYQAACKLSYDLDMRQLAHACKLALDSIGTATPSQLIHLLSAVSTCVEALPTLQSQLSRPAPAGLSAASMGTAVNSKSATAVTAVRDVVLAACSTLQPQLHSLSPNELIVLASSIKSCRYADLVMQKHTSPIRTGIGQGATGVHMVNSYPITVIHNNIESGASQTTSTSSMNSTTQVLPGAETATQPQRLGFIQKLHESFISQLDDFKDSQAVADFIRPLAVSRLLPDRTLLSQLCEKIEESGRLAASRPDLLAMTLVSVPGKPATTKGMMSDHAVCLALFLLNMLGYKPSQTVIQAAQEQLCKHMSLLSPSDLTTAVWAFACLNPLQQTLPRTLDAGHTLNNTQTATDAHQRMSRTSIGSTKQPTVEKERKSHNPANDDAQSSDNSKRLNTTRTLADIAAANTVNAKSSQPRDPPVWAQRLASQPAGVRPAATLPHQATSLTWLQPAIEAIDKRVQQGQLQPYQLAFILGSLERCNAQLQPQLIDKLLDSFLDKLVDATSADVVLVLVSVARIGHVTKYSWTEAVVEGHLLPLLPSCTPKELASIGYSLARLHHHPSQQFLTTLVDSAETQLSSFTADNIATLVWSVAELDAQAPVTLFMDSVCNETMMRLGELTPRDLVSLLAAMARLRYQPSAEWLSEWMRALDCHLPFIDGEGLAQVVSALASIDARVNTTSRRWDRIMGAVLQEMSHMDADSLLALAAGLSCLDVKPSSEWTHRFAEAVDRVCSASMEWGQGMRRDRTCLTPSQHELLLASQIKLDIPPTDNQMRDLETRLAGLSSLKELGAERLVRLVRGLAVVASKWKADAPLPRSAWLGGPFCEALRAALADLPLVQQSQLARVLGDLLSAMEVRYNEATVAAEKNEKSDVTALERAVTAQDESGASQMQADSEQLSSRQVEKPPDSLKNLCAYLREFYLWQ